MVDIAKQSYCLQKAVIIATLSKSRKNRSIIPFIIFMAFLTFCILLTHNAAYSDNIKEGNLDNISEDVKNENADRNALPYQEEELNYRVSWSKFITAGSAVLSLSPGIYKADTPALIGRAVARSAKWMKILGIDVEDVIETVFDTKFNFSYFFTATIKETDYKKAKSITFDWDNKKIEYIERGTVAYFELKEWTHDVLSALYYVRTLPLKEGKSFYVHVFDEGKEYLLEVIVISVEVLNIQDQEIPSFKTKIILKTKGIFNRKGDIYIWFSDDSRKIPIQMQCDIFLGFFHVELTDVRAFFHYR